MSAGCKQFFPLQYFKQLIHVICRGKEGDKKEEKEKDKDKKKKKKKDRSKDKKKSTIVVTFHVRRLKKP